MAKKGKIYIGTSGWHYSHWRGPFYPANCAEKHFLDFYLQHFSTVEINRTFYSLPDKSVFLDYAEKVTKPFIFSVKASRFITHVKKLKDPKRPLKNFLSRVEGLKSHLGPILFQLPPKWKVNAERLEAFLNALPKKKRYVFELRDKSWLNDEVLALLKKYRIAFCIYEIDHFLTPKLITADFIYVRLHGPKSAYQGNYSLNTLKNWAAFFRKESKKGKDIYCYFDNDENGYAAKNALQLKKMLNN